MSNNEKLRQDMQYLGGIYGWDESDFAEIRRAAKEDRTWLDYWPQLAESWHQAEAGVYRPMFYGVAT